MTSCRLVWCGRTIGSEGSQTGSVRDCNRRTRLRGYGFLVASLLRNDTSRGYGFLVASLPRNDTSRGYGFLVASLLGMTPRGATDSSSLRSFGLTPRSLWLLPRPARYTARITPSSRT